MLAFNIVTGLLLSAFDGQLPVSLVSNYSSYNHYNQCRLLIQNCNFRVPSPVCGADVFCFALFCFQARAFYGFQIAIENIHSGMQSVCLHRSSVILRIKYA